MINRISRRGFLKQTTLGAAALALGAPSILPSTALGKSGAMAPSERIRIGCIGVGGMGGYHTVQYGSGGLSARRDVQIVAICDVDAERREPIADAVEKTYADRFGKSRYRGVARYNDFRELLARDDIDAVLIATPDHWHALISIAAVQAGKDVYCEKPMTHNIAEGQALVQAVRRYGRVFQTGTQQRSWDIFRVACQIVRNGWIGKLKSIQVGLYPSGSGVPASAHPAMPIPPGFDYEQWLGPAPWAPYTQGRCHGQFRQNFDYSGGVITDWGAHHLDIAQWGNGTDHTGPIEIEGRGTFPSEGIYNTVQPGYHIRCTYANGVQLVCRDGFSPGVKFIGTDGWTFVNRGAADASDKSLLTRPIGPDDVRLYEADHHWDNFFRCVRTREEPSASVEVGHRSVSICHMANIMMRLDRKLKWDPKNETFVDDAEANRMLGRAMRSPWRL